MGVPNFVPWLRRPCRHLAIAYLGADRPCRRAHRGFNVARRYCNEARCLRRSARGHEPFSAGPSNVEQMDRRSGRYWNCLRSCGGAAAARPEIRHWLLECESHGFRPSWPRYRKRSRRVGGGAANVFTRRNRCTPLRRCRTNDLSTDAHARPRRLGAGLLILATIAIGVYPKLLLDRIQPAVESMRFLKTGG